MRKLGLLTAAVLVTVFGVEAAWAAPPTFTSGTTGAGATASQTPAGIELFTPDGEVGDAFVRILIPGGVAVQNILEVTYTGQLLDVGVNPSTFSPEVVLNVDADGDGLPVEGNFPDWHLSGGIVGDPAQLGFVNAGDRGDNWLSLDGVNLLVVDGAPVIRAALDDTAGPSGEDASGWFSPDATRALGAFAPLTYQPDFTTLLGELPSTTDIDATDLVGSIDLIIGGSSNFDGNRFLISSVTVNLDGEVTTLNLRGLVKEITSGPCVSDPDVVCESDDLSLGFEKVADGIANPSFEDFSGVCIAGPGGFGNSGTAPGSIDGWTVEVNQVHYICGWQESQDGGNSIDMNGTANAGAILKQDIDTEVGRNYQVKFWMAGTSNLADKDEAVDASADTCGGPLVKGLDVTAAGTTEGFTFDTTGTSRNSMGWEEKTFAFTATGVTATLEFESTTASHCGAAVDNVMLFVEEFDEIAVAVLAPSASSIHYDFKITVDTTGRNDPVVYDTVPAEWTVTHIDGGLVGPDGTSPTPQFDENLPGENLGVGCGGSDVLGDVTVFRGGSSKKNKCSSSTHLVWDMDPDETDMIRVDLQSRGPKKNGKYKPTFCGALYLNNGAELMDGSATVATSNRLVVAAMFDLGLDGEPGIDPTGQGDEDIDGLTDIDEVRVYGTEPCNPDTDGDGLSDGDEVADGTNPNNPDTDGDGVVDSLDLCPLEGLEVSGFVDADGCPFTP